MFNVLTKVVLLQSVLLLFSLSNVKAYDKVYELSLSELETLQVSENKVILNNFCIAEDNAFMAKGTSKVVVTFSVANRTDTVKHFTAMIVGLENNIIIWCVDAEPSFSSVSENKTEECSGSAYVPPGTLKKTTKIWLRVVGNF